MKKLLIQLERELKAFFFSPIAYVVLLFLLITMGANFMLNLLSMNGQPGRTTIAQGFFLLAPWFGSLFVVPPLLTMRLFSEEFRMGTIEPLATSPINDLQIVLAKFLAAFLFYLIIWTPTFLYFFEFHRATDESPGAVWSGYLIMWLMGMFYISIGCLASVLTRNQIIAAIASFAMTTLFFFAGFLKVVTQGATPLFRDIVDYFSALEHLDGFTKGIIDSRAIVYYVTMTCLMLYLTFQAFQYRKWRA